MDCGQCEDRMMDLLYEELGPPEAAEARSHLSGCSSCRASLERLGGARRLAAQLPLEDPPARLDGPILAAARRRAAGEPGGKPGLVRAKSARELGGRAWWRSLLDMLRSLALGPQVAMATVMLLVVAIGLWYLPGARRAPEGGGEVVVSPDPAGEAGPSAAVTPRQETGSGNGLVLSEGEPADAEESEENEPAARELATEATAPATERRKRSRAQGRGAQPSEEKLAREGAGRRQEALASPSLRRRAPARDLSRTGRAAESAAAPSASAPSDRYATEADDALGVEQPSRRSRRAAAPRSRSGAAAEAPMAEAQMAGAPMAQAEDLGTRTDYARGISHYRQRQYEAAIEDFDAVATRPAPDARTLVPNAMLHIARSHRAQGACGAAAGQYETLLRGYPRHPQVPAAMMELADCYERLGQLARAETWLEQAAQKESTRAMAEERLRRLRRSRSTPAAAASEAE